MVKVGSSLLVDGASGALRRDWLVSLCADVAALRRQGAKVILVSSGSIALGRNLLKLPPGALRLEESQAAAAAGQVRLAQAYSDLLAGENLVAAQILLTLGDTEERDRYLNARATLNTLLDLGAVPVINENDTVATAEIRFGDNDRLGARVASMMGADKLILLSDVDGLYTANPVARCLRRAYSRSRRHHRRNRSHGRRQRFRPGPGRHDLQADRRQDRHRRGLRCHHRQGRKPSSGRGHREWRAPHAFSAPACRPPWRASAGSRAGSSRKACW